MVCFRLAVFVPLFANTFWWVYRHTVFWNAFSKAVQTVVRFGNIPPAFYLNTSAFYPFKKFYKLQKMAKIGKNRIKNVQPLQFLWLSYQFKFVVNTCFNSRNRFRYGKKVCLPLFAFTVAKWLFMNREQSFIVLHLFSFMGWVGNVIPAK